jgi:general stress protein 26
MSTHTDDVKKLATLIEKIEIAMMTTVSKDGWLHSRPMYTQRHDFDGTLWFFVSKNSVKVDEIANHPRVNISYAAPNDQRYVSVSGTAALVEDRAQAKKFWSPLYKAWFPGGLDDPELALLRIDVEHAEYWDPPSGIVVQLAGFLKAIATGERARGGDHQKVNL